MKVKLIVRQITKISLIFMLAFSPCSARKQKTIRLLKPQIDKGQPLMRVLKNRKSSHNFDSKGLPHRVLSDLLWAAFGINRPESEYNSITGASRRTAPSSSNYQEIDIYMSAADGLYIYDAREHFLKMILEKDIRAQTGLDTYIRNAPVNLICVADFSKIRQAFETKKIFCAAADTGFISENVYLYCASEGLSTVVRGLIDRSALEKAMNLEANQKVILAQSVGYPKE